VTSCDNLWLAARLLWIFVAAGSTAGRGNAKKPDMLAAVCNRWKVVTSDDEADAIALLYFALAELVPSGR
jgi:Holliday junction resolvasome RuvABC endonuclease subunit